MTVADGATVWVLVRPTGTVCVRDGRDLDMGGSAVAVAVAPSPSTLAGAVAAAADDPRPGVSLRSLAGPILVDPDLGAVFPAPVDLVTEGGGRAHVLKRPDLLADDDGEPADGVLFAAQLQRYLLGAATVRLRPSPLVAEPRVGLARTGRVAQSGMLYRAEHLRLAEGWAFAMRCRVVDGHAVRGRLVRLGGQGGHATVEPLAAAPVLPDPPDRFPCGRVLVYLATPALFADGTAWCPSPAQQAGLACAGPQPIASATRGRPTARLDWAVPGGTVFYLTFPTEQQAAAWATEHHASCLPGQHPELARTAGFGLALMGRWA